jgi:hypothetical protein
MAVHYGRVAAAPNAPAFGELRDRTLQAGSGPLPSHSGMLPRRPNGRQRTSLARSHNRSSFRNSSRTSSATRLERSLGSGLQIAEDGEHPSVVSV